MTELIVIAAVAENGVIGCNGQIPWHFSEDMKFFRNETIGHACIMGRKTYESLPVKPLPGRRNIVLSKSKFDGPFCSATSFEEALEKAQRLHESKVYVIGGASVYSEALKYADTIKITRVHGKCPGDVFFPEFDSFDLVDSGETEDFDKKSGRIVKLTFETYRTFGVP